MKICLIANLAPHYREEIYRLIDRELQCDFVFGDTLNNGIRTFDPSGFINDVTVVRNVQKGEVTLWQRGILRKLSGKYDAYLVSGDIRCLSTWLFLLLAWITGRKTYMWAHGCSGKESARDRIIKKIFYNLAEGVFLYGGYARKIMIDSGFAPDRLWVIHNSLAYSRQKQIRLGLKETDIYRSRFGNEDPTLIFIGRLTSSKRIDMILEAMTILQSRLVFCNLVLIGAGPESGSLSQYASMSGLEDRVWLYGACYDETINAELIYNADLCVSPGNIGLTAIHVLTYGTPAITHDAFMYQGPEFESIIPRLTGDFYEYGNVTSMAERIEAWLYDNGDLREDVRKACFREIDRYWTPEYQINVIKKHLK